jgi:hypothetical protein
VRPAVLHIFFRKKPPAKPPGVFAAVKFGRYRVCKMGSLFWNKPADRDIKNNTKQHKTNKNQNKY